MWPHFSCVTFKKSHIVVVVVAAVAVATCVDSHLGKHNISPFANVQKVHEAVAGAVIKDSAWCEVKRIYFMENHLQGLLAAALKRNIHNRCIFMWIT